MKFNANDKALKHASQKCAAKVSKLKNDPRANPLTEANRYPGDQPADCSNR
jgi:hypothetical protein